MTPVLMPQVGENLTTGVLLEWCKAEGEPLSRGDVIAVVESEKAAFEVVAEEDGVLLRQDVAAGEPARVLEPIAWIGKPGEDPDAADPAPAPPPAAATRLSPSGAASPATARPAVAGRDRAPEAGVAVPPPAAGAPASPSARRLARQLLVDLASVRGSGPGGRVVRRDVLTAALNDSGGAVAPASVPAAVEQGDRLVPHSRLRRAVAERMSASARHVPHFHLFADVDVTEAQALRREMTGEPAVSLTDLLIAAAAQALRRHERLNAHVGDSGIVLKAGCHVGLAVAVEEGVLVPALADADRKGLEELAEARTALVEGARRGLVPPAPAPTFTVTNLGAYGITRFLPLINPPECGILAAGRSEERVVARAGAPAVREIITLVLACDHRAVDGAYAAGFLEDVQQGLERPRDLPGGGGPADP